MTTVYINVFDEDAKVEAIEMAKRRRPPLMWVGSARLVDAKGAFMDVGYAMKFQDRDELDWEMKTRGRPQWGR